MGRDESKVVMEFLVSGAEALGELRYISTIVLLIDLEIFTDTIDFDLLE